MLKKLLSAENVDVEKINSKEGNVIHTHNIDVVIDLSIGVNKEEQTAKIMEEIAKAKSELKRAEGMLANEKFVAKAPEKLIQAEKEKVIKYTEIIKKLEDSLK